MRIEAELVNYKQVQDFFNKIVNRAKNPRQAFLMLGSLGVKDVHQHFTDERGPDYSWEKIARKGKILRDTGRLWGSIRSRAFEREVHIFTNVKYAGYHQFGTKYMDKREFMWVSKAFLKLATKIFGKYIISGI